MGRSREMQEVTVDDSLAPSQERLRDCLQMIEGKQLIRIEQLDALERAGEAEPWLRRQYDRFWPWNGTINKGQ